MTPVFTQYSNVSYTWSITDGISLDIPVSPWVPTMTLYIEFKFTKKDGRSTYWWGNWTLYIDMNWWPTANHRMKINGVESDWDYNYYYSYLPVRERKLTEIWEYYWMKGTSFQPLYSWVSSWVDINGEKKTRYDFTQYAGVVNDPWMDVIWMIVWNEQVYMIW
jgi:hypothetical protein